MRTLIRIKLATVAVMAVSFASLAAPAIARDLGVSIGSGAGVSTGIANSGAIGAGVGIGASVGSSWNGATDVSAGADGQIATSASANFQSNGSTGSAPPGLDRLSIQGDGKANVSVFYKVLKTKF